MKTVKTNDNQVLFDDAFGVYKIEITQEQKAKMKLKKGNDILR